MCGWVGTEVPRWEESKGTREGPGGSKIGDERNPRRWNKKTTVQVAGYFHTARSVCVASAAESVSLHCPVGADSWGVAHPCRWLLVSLRGRSSSTWNDVALERFPEDWECALIKGQLTKSEAMRWALQGSHLLCTCESWGQRGPGWSSSTGVAHSIC